MTMSATSNTSCLSVRQKPQELFCVSCVDWPKVAFTPRMKLVAFEGPLNFDALLCVDRINVVGDLKSIDSAKGK